jgi:N,N'-diacetyllegionaminate synthase
MSALVVIPARGGSKRLPGKNLQLVGGVSLIGHAVMSGFDFVEHAGLDGASVIVDTDAPDIAAEARLWGAQVPFLRDARLAQDGTSTVDSVVALLDRLGAPNETPVILLQPTSPLRTAGDIAECWAVFDPRKRPSVVSVSRVTAGVPIRTGGDQIEQIGGELSLLEISGSVYICTAGFLRERRAFTLPGETAVVELPPERSVDIDTLDDLEAARAHIRARPSATVRIGDREIGVGRPCFIIAEAGVNHNGSLDLARQLIDVAVDSGADAVKFQTFDADMLASPDAKAAEYQQANAGADSQLDMLRALSLPHAAFAELARYAESRGIVFLSTAFDEGSSDFIETLRVPAFKIPSGEITNNGLLSHIARKGKPVLLSTGMSNMAEVWNAVRLLKECPVAIFHCVSNYPTAPADCNLGAMDALRETFAVPVGWSDHTEGLTISIASVAAGANILEKHFTLNRQLPGPDHLASLEPDELRALVQAVRDTEAAMSSRPKRAIESEIAIAASVRRSLHTVRDLPSGHRLQQADLIALRPGHGIPPARASELIGRVLLRPLSSRHLLMEDDFDPHA